MSVRSPDRVIFTAFCFLFALLVSTIPSQAQLQLRISPGSQFQPMPIAIADFSGRGGSRAAGVGHHHRRTCSARAISAARQGALSRTPVLRRRAALRGVEARGRAGARDGPRHPRSVGTPESRIPPVGCGYGPAARRPAIRHRSEFLAPHRAISSRTRSTPRSRASAASSTRAWCSSMNPARRKTAASASPSWIRTAPMCAS